MKRFNPCAAAAAPETAPETPMGTPLEAPAQPLVVGSRIHCILYGGADGIIYKIKGEQKPETISKLGGGVGVMGGNAYFDIVFVGDRAHTSSVPESIVHGSVQWAVLDGIAGADEITTALAAAEARRVALEAESERKSTERAARRAELPKQFRFLETIAQQKGNGARTKSSHALGSANLKAQLARAFPGVKFSVKSESYSGGDAIRVHWDCGPTIKEVEAISGQYQEGSFDGMTDCYNYDRDNVWTDVFGGAKYVTESRSFPDSLYEQVGRALCALQHLQYDGQHTRHLLGTSDNKDLSSHVHGLLHATTFPIGATFRGVEHTPDERGVFEWCRITFDLLVKATLPALPPAAGAITLIENKERNLIELRFPGKPDDSTRAELKAAKWRWFGPAGCWYHRDNPENRAFALAFLERHNTPAQAAAPVEMQQSRSAIANESAEIAELPTCSICQTEPPTLTAEAFQPSPSVPSWRRRHNPQPAI